MPESILTFPKGGIHPQESKDFTAKLPIEVMPVPQEVYIMLAQHFGSPCTPVVKKKDEVREGDLIGHVEKGLGANIHSSVSGKVKNLSYVPHPSMVSAQAVVVETDPEAGPAEYPQSDWKELSRDQLVEKVKDAGIVGLGGAGFPTHVKLSPPPEARVDTLLLNGAECEPYLTSDHRLMVEHPNHIMEGAKILLAILGIQECHIGIEINKSDAIEAMQKAAVWASSDRFKIFVDPLKVKYPQGSEKQLIHSITGRRVPGFGLPFDVGVVVQNVGTVKGVYDAVVLNKPLYERVVSISGGGIQRPANLLVRIGTKISEIVTHLGGVKAELSKVVMGGPMMGFAVPDLEVTITKTTSGVLFLTEEEIDASRHSQCIRCGWCVDVCPMGLSPKEIGIYVEGGWAEETAKFGVFECFECGCCAYICPSKRPLVQFIRLAKSRAKK